MIFKKPENVRYVDMAMYIDDHAYSDDADEALIYEYIFHLCRMIARKRELFKKVAELDEFSLYASSYVMHRYKNKKQFIIENGVPKMAKIKRVLNYIKAVIYKVSIRYREENYASKKHKVEEIDLTNTHNFRDSLLNSSGKMRTMEFDLYINDIPRTIREYLKKIPYTGVELKNIHISCLMTLMSWMTLSVKNEKRVQNLSKYTKTLDGLLCSLYEQERKSQVILYDLDDSMRDYIRVLCNRLRNIMIGDLNYLLTSGCVETDLKDLLLDCVENI